MIDVERTIISQYANSPTLCGLIDGFNQCIDPRSNIQAFLDYVWNVQTAQGFGLDIWGKIVGLNTREVIVTADIDYFGFDTGVTDTFPFGEGIFYVDADGVNVYRLSDTAFRTAILIKAMSNISRCTVQSINRIISRLFRSRGACYVIDLGGMRMRYVFEFAMFPWEEAVVDQLNILPKPAGVELLEKAIIASSYFGFAEMGNYITPFDESPFYN